MITPIYASLIAMIFLFMTFKVISHRRANRISIGDGGDVMFSRLIRGHSNLTEYAPISLLLILMLELQSETTIVVHLIGIILVIGRVFHAYAFTQPEAFRERTIGMIMTLNSIVLGILANLYQSLT